VVVSKIQAKIFSQTDAENKFQYKIAFQCHSRSRIMDRVGRGSNFLNPIQSINFVTQSNPIHDDDVNADPHPIQSICLIAGI